jgi:hypothetical protein
VSRRDREADDEVVEVLVAAAILAHQRQQLLDVAGADVDDDVVDRLQELLQLAELLPRSAARCPSSALMLSIATTSAPAIRGARR